MKKCHPNLYKELTDFNLFFTMPIKRRLRLISGKEANDAKLRLRFILAIIWAVIWFAYLFIIYCTL